MRYPIDEKTGKPYGMPKGAKPQEETTPEMTEEALREVNEERLKSGIDEVKERQDEVAPPKKKKEAVDKPDEAPKSARKKKK